MDDAPTPTPPVPEGPPETPLEPGAGGKGNKRPIVALMLAIALAAAGAGLAWALVAFEPDSDLASTVPADTMLFASIQVDPPGDQGRHLASIVEKFPALSDALGRDPLEDVGLSWKRDVEPWLGKEAAVAIRSKGGETEVALLAHTDDPKAASAFLQKLRASGPLSGGTTEAYKGVDIIVASEGTAAVAESTMIASPSLSYTKSVIDTIKGAPSLAGEDDFQDTTESLPRERLALLYASSTASRALPALGDVAQREIGANGPPAGLPPVANPFAGLQAVRGYAMSLSAEADGISIRLTGLIDPDALPQELRKLYTELPAPHRNAVLRWTPENAYGLVAITGLNVQARAVLQQLGTFGTGIPEVQRIIDLLSGDAGLFLGPGSPPQPLGGAALFAVRDDEQAREALRSLEAALTAASTPDGGIGLDGSAGEGPTWSEIQHDGVTIRFLTNGEVGAPAFAYAVTDGMAILGLSPESVQSSLDARRANIENAPTFREALAHVESQNQSLVFADLQAIVSALSESGDLMGQEEAEILRHLRPLKALIVATTGSEERSEAELFLVID